MKIELTQAQYEKLITFTKWNFIEQIGFNVVSDNIEFTNVILNVQSLLRHVINESAKNVKKDNEGVIRCKHCGNDVEFVEADHALFDGTIERIAFNVNKTLASIGIAEMEFRDNWCGTELSSEEEAMNTIHCPHCGKFPFSKNQGINTRTLVKVICTEGDG